MQSAVPEVTIKATTLVAEAVETVVMTPMVEDVEMVAAVVVVVTLPLLIINGRFGRLMVLLSPKALP